MKAANVAAEVKALEPYLKRQARMALGSDRMDPLVQIMRAKQYSWTFSEWMREIKDLSACQLTVGQWLEQNTVQRDGAYFTKESTAQDGMDPCA